MKKTLLAVSFLGLALSAPQAFAVAKGDPARGKELSATCVACHGPDGNSPVSAFPRIAGQHADYMIHAMQAYKNGQRSNPIMQGIVAPLSLQDMQDLSAFFSRQSGDLFQLGLEK